MKKLKIIIILFPFILFFSCHKDKLPPLTPMPQELKDYIFFKKGTYWVYKDTIVGTSARKSMGVTKARAVALAKAFWDTYASVLARSLQDDSRAGEKLNPYGSAGLVRWAYGMWGQGAAWSGYLHITSNYITIRWLKRQGLCQAF